MEKFIKLEAVIAPLPIVNIDTDMIIPKQFLKTIKRTGLGKNLFDEMRFTPDGEEVKEFILNKEPYRKAKVIVAGDNFGCGSSREHAPWALVDFGITCIIAPSFADIFYNNSFKNGILPITLPQADIDVITEYASKDKNPVISIDLPAQTITCVNNGKSFAFNLDPFNKKCLLEGLDDIGLTLAKHNKITSYVEGYKHKFPWLF